MNLNDISTQLLYTTVPIYVERTNGQQSMGTGFFFNMPANGPEGQIIPFLVTNHHVVKDAKRGWIELATREGGEPARGKKARVEVGPDFFRGHSDPNLDLAAIPVAPLFTHLEANARPVFYRSVEPSIIPKREQVEDLGAIEEIVFIGYPSGLQDTHNVSPLTRRGITATPIWNDFEGQPRFLIDAGVFPGSSGSPVFILNQGAYATRSGLSIGSRLFFVGVIAESILRNAPDEGKAYLGIGKVINSSAVKEFLERRVRELLAPRPV